MKIKQLSIFLQNRMGSLSKPLEVLTVADVNIRAMCMADTSEFGILRLVVDDPEKGKEALEQNNFLVKITEIIGVEMNDTPGGLTSVLNTIKENNIDLEYLYFHYCKPPIPTSLFSCNLYSESFSFAHSGRYFSSKTPKKFCLLKCVNSSSFKKYPLTCEPIALGSHPKPLVAKNN